MDAIADGGMAQPYQPASAWWAVALLFVASILSVIDRGILSIVVDAVKADIGLSDIQISLLQGLAFGLFYAVVGVWLGFIADRMSRRNLILGGIALWSIATAASGLVHSFGAMFACRLLVGLGEAALAPAAISLIADLFPPAKRGRAIGIYLMGQSVATGISFFAAGSLLHFAGAGGFAHVPVLAGLAPWRTIFLLCGVAGFVMVLAYLTVREPARANAGSQADGGHFRAVVAHFRARRGQLACLYGGFAMFFLGSYAALGWQVVMLSRRFAMEAGTVAIMLSPVSLAFGIVGPLVGGMLVDGAVRRGGPTAILALLRFAPLLGLIFCLANAVSSQWAAVLLVATLGGTAAIMGTATLAWLQATMPADMRGIAVSGTGLVNTVLGATMGPLLVAVLTDKLFADPAKVGAAIVWVAAPAFLVSALLYAIGHRIAAVAERKA
ncbi:MAG TPA: MFS transporter [Sphingobium sp.]